MRARDLMTANPLRIEPTATLSEAMGVLSLGGIRHLPVVDDGRLVGMVSERDLLDCFHVDQDRLEEGSTRTISEVMSGKLYAVDVDASVKEVIEMMLEGWVGAVLVTEGEGELAGIISYVDILEAAKDRFD